MTVDQSIQLARDAVFLSLLIGAPIMVMAVVVGLAISILQAVTQIQDQTISFVPKLIAMMFTLVYVLPWTLNRMMEYSTELISNIAGTV